MKINKIFKGINFEILNADVFPEEQLMNLEIPDICIDSRKLRKQSIFFALIGHRVDGHKYLNEVIEKGAAVLVVSKKVDKDILKRIPVIKVNNTLKILNRIAPHFFDFPSDDLEILGITGTNGKTTTAYFIHSVLKTAGIKNGLIGTVKYIIDDEEFEAPNTTPCAIELQRILYKMRQKGDKVVVMEVSSHALKEDRTYGIFYSGVGLTNLTKEHLDYHKTLDNYAKVKAKLFRRIRKGGTAVLNLDSEYADFFLKQIHFAYCKFLSISLKDKSADIYADDIQVSHKGTIFKLHFKDKVHILNLRMPGIQNVYNALIAFALTSSLKMLDIPTIVKGLEALETVPGRFEIINEDQKFMVVVDYAHTEDALKNLLNLAKKLPHKRIITIFGCGGDRDNSKRPGMGKIASELSDHVIITTDNPRTESPSNIIKNILDGIKAKEGFEVVEDREEAIKKGIELCKEGDILLIAGKGHEDYQILGDKRIHFDDKEISRKYLKELK